MRYDFEAVYRHDDGSITVTVEFSADLDYDRVFDEDEVDEICFSMLRNLPVSDMHLKGYQYTPTEVEG